MQDGGKFVGGHGWWSFVFVVRWVCTEEAKNRGFD